MSAIAQSLAEDQLQALDRQVELAVRAGDDSELPVLGYGEISLVLGWPPREPEFACKLLPVFPTRTRFDAYRQTLDDYVEALRERGVDVVETELRPVTRDDGSVAGYAVQPVLPAATLAPARLAGEGPVSDHPLARAIVETAYAAISPRLGIDAQLSNWTWEEGRLRYLDVTTPMIWSAQGHVRLDLNLLVQPLPGPMRWPVKRFLAPGILDGYRNRRGVVSDLCGNLIKEQLENWIAVFLEIANRGLDPAMTEQDVRRYYRRDARLWELLLRVRMLDRAWQHRVRRHPYPFLLPRRVAR